MAKDSNGKSDPLASLKFFDHTTVKTDKIKKTLDPEWNKPTMYSWTGPQVALLDRIEAKCDVCVTVPITAAITWLGRI
jgi:hypothetical protein